MYIMKKQVFALTLLPIIAIFAGCTRTEDDYEDLRAETAQAEAVEVTESAGAEAETAMETVETESEISQTTNSLVAAADALKEAIPQLEEEIDSMANEEEMEAVMAETSADLEEVVVAETKAMEVPEPETVVVTKEVAVMEVDVPEVEAVEEESESLVAKAMDTAGGLASGLDLSNLSWDKVSEIPYNDKTALLAWATQQATTWKGKLTDAAMDQGTSMLNNLGDSGWQGALKKVMDALDGVREASPETWQMARGALVSAWQTFETQATAFLGKE
jgi:myosin heavy subunit